MAHATEQCSRFHFRVSLPTNYAPPKGTEERVDCYRMTTVTSSQLTQYEKHCLNKNGIPTILNRRVSSLGKQLSICRNRLWLVPHASRPTILHS